MTLEDFLAWEDRQPSRHEFDGVRAIAMTGGTVNHAAIQINLATAMNTRLRGRPCRFFGNDLKIAVAGRVRYPDGFVVCSPVQADSTVVTEPVVIFEVLSDSTSRTDLITKNDEYANTPSVKRYVLLVADSVLRMPEIGVEFPLKELYEGVDLPDVD